MNKKTTTKTAKSGSVIIQTASLDTLSTDPKDPFIGSLDLLLEPVDKNIDLRTVFAIDGKSRKWEFGFGYAKLRVKGKRQELQVFGYTYKGVFESEPWELVENPELIKAYLPKLAVALAALVKHSSKLVLQVRQLKVLEWYLKRNVHENSRTDHVEEGLRVCLCGGTKKPLKGAKLSKPEGMVSAGLSRAIPSKRRAPTEKVKAKPVKASASRKARNDPKPA